MSHTCEHEGWDDLNFPLTTERRGAGGKPDYDFTNLGLLFPQNDPAEIAYFIIQMRHEKQLVGPNTYIKPHVHYVQDSSDTPTFKVDYRWYNNGGDPTVAFTTVAQTGNVFTYTAGSIMQIASFAAIAAPASETLSSICDVKLYRDDNDLAGDCLAKHFDMHVFNDSTGSFAEYTKG